ncbi:hypothetical protein [Nocardioides convexus]|uniref:hypothetical protein n=1 Tax=Nocardioides convexus TaxID=2712224 RepID=UPI00241874AA|nr:hypothetical protein [Nocardioides convexus]
MIAVAGLSSEGLTITPIARDESRLRLGRPRAAGLAGDRAPPRRGPVGDAGDDVEGLRLRAPGAAPDAARGGPQPHHADRGRGRGDRHRVWSGAASPTRSPTRAPPCSLLPRLAPEAGWVSLRPRVHDTMAIVHRAGATLSPAARLVIDLATQRIQAILEPV